MLSRIMFTSLGRLPNFLPDGLPFVRLVLSDRFAQYRGLILVEFGVVHVFVPMLLHATLGSRRERLGNLTPTFVFSSHLL